MLKDLQALLLAACRQREPAQWLRQQLQDSACTLDAEERAQLQSLVVDGANPVAADGMRLTRLLVDKLRLERLLRGAPAAAAAFVADTPAFLVRFRRYCEAVPPTAVFPSEEAARFLAFESGSS